MSGKGSDNSNGGEAITGGSSAALPRTTSLDGAFELLLLLLLFAGVVVEVVVDLLALPNGNLDEVEGEAREEVAVVEATAREEGDGTLFNVLVVV